MDRQREEDIVMNDVPNQRDLVEESAMPQPLRRPGQPRASILPVNPTGNVDNDSSAFVNRNQPQDITNEAGHRVRVYEHTTTRRITFAPNVAPSRPVRAPGMPMFETERRPTPFPPARAATPLPPLRPARVPGTAMYEIERRPTPFPDLNAPDLRQMPSQAAIDFQRGYADRYRDYQEQRAYEARRHAAHQRQGVQGAYTGGTQRHGFPQQRHGMERPHGGMRVHSSPPPTHARFNQPFLGYRPPLGIDEQEMTVDEDNEYYAVHNEYGAVPWEDQTPFDRPAADRRRRMGNLPRPANPTFEREDDDDDSYTEYHPLRAHPGHRPLRAADWHEEEDSDDEASLKQNRPEDYERPRGRRLHRGGDYQNPEDAPVDAPEESHRPAITLMAGLNQAPLYGKIMISRDRRTFKYHRTTRFNTWLQSAVDNRTPPDDYFHEWLRAKEAEDAQKKRHPTKMPDFDPPKPTNAPPAQPSAVSPQPASVAPKGKRGVDDHEEQDRPSKRARLASTFRRKLSMSSGANNGTTFSSGDTSMSVSKKRLSGLDMFTVRSISVLPGLSTLSRASSVGPKRVRVAVIGDSFAGKTTLLNRLYTGMYQPAQKSLHFRNNDFTMAIDGHPVILEAWDIPGEAPADETHPLNRSFFDAALVCVAVDNLEKVDKAPYWVHLLQSCLVVDIPIYLVGLKSDSRPAFPKLRLPFTNEAVPSTLEQCETVARKVGAVEYFECSAKTGEGVKEMFDAVIRQARSRKDEEELKRASRLQKEKLRRGAEDAGRRLSALFCGPGKNV